MAHVALVVAGAFRKFKTVMEYVLMVELPQYHSHARLRTRPDLLIYASKQLSKLRQNMLDGASRGCARTAQKVMPTPGKSYGDNSMSSTYLPN